jgi:hypothetical protein
MLIQKPLTKGTVVVLKLANHPVEVIARLEEELTQNGPVTVRRPLEAHITATQTGGLGLAFMPFSMSARDDQLFTFPASALMHPPFAAREEVSKTYTEQTTSLTLPS